MIRSYPISISGFPVIAIEVHLPKTTLLAVTTDQGYIMCGALDIHLFNTNAKLLERGIIAGRAVGVRTIEDLLDAPLESVTRKAEELGIHPGMKGRDALEQMLKYEGKLA